MSSNEGIKKDEWIFLNAIYCDVYQRHFRLHNSIFSCARFFFVRIILDFYNVVRIFCDFSPHPSFTLLTLLANGKNRKYLHSLKNKFEFQTRNEEKL